VDSEQEKLNERIRETISSLPDRELLHVVDSTSGQYTRFAVEVARGEIARRGGEGALRKRLSQGRAGKAPGEPGLLRAPKEKPAPAGAATGCYIEVWRDKDFEGECLIIEGPGEIADLCSNKSTWCSRIRSLRVGPQAFVLAYGDKNFKGDMMRLGPSEEVPDLGNVKFDNAIDSMRIVDSIKVFDCTSSREKPTPVPSEATSDKDSCEKDSIEDQSETPEFGTNPRHRRRRH
jgi:hypothetical protein